MKPSWNSAKPDLGDGMNMCSQPSGCIGQYRIHACQAKSPPSPFYLVVTAALRWTPPHQAPTTRAWTDYITSLLTRAKALIKTSPTKASCPPRTTLALFQWVVTCHVFRTQGVPGPVLVNWSGPLGYWIPCVSH